MRDMGAMNNKTDVAPTTDLAECGACGRNKPVCCDEGYSENPATGKVEHVGATCRDCCRHGAARPWPTFERMDCDQ